MEEEVHLQRCNKHLSIAAALHGAECDTASIMHALVTLSHNLTHNTRVALLSETPKAFAEARPFLRRLSESSLLPRS